MLMRGQDGLEFEAHELMVCRIAREVDDSGVTVLGSFTPLAYAAYMLAKLTDAPDAVIVAFNAVGVRPVTLSMTLMESAFYCGAVASWSFKEIVNTIHLAGRGLVECISAAQFDGDGAFNLSAIGPYDHPKVRLPGGAGSPEVAEAYSKMVAYVGVHDRRTLVSSVDFRTGGRGAFDPSEPSKALTRPFLIVTPLAVLRRDADDQSFAIESVHPGVSVDDVIARTGFPLDYRQEVPTTSSPSAEHLRILREEVDPAGTARFDLLDAKSRRQLVRQILAAEWARGEGLASTRT
jgi:glutaconate CoA-transferase, subunit B